MKPGVTLDLSKLKVDVYDFLGIILPGLLAIAEGWILLRGWNSFVDSMTHLSGLELTLLLVFAFGVGHLVQELGDVFVQVIRGKGHLHKSRHKFWRTEEAQIVKQTIELELGHEISSVDGAYDYCLTRLNGRFEKRGIFVATSDLSRSLVALSLLSLVPVCRIAFHDVTSLHRSLAIIAMTIACVSAISSLSWRRMNRYRDFSEATVFRAYLALAREGSSASAAPK